jgi:serine/threonine-protein kinase
VSPHFTQSGRTRTGTQRFGKYEIVRPLTAGGMAEIFLAQLLGPEGFVKPVVLKRILPEYAASQEFIHMFLAEARLAARVSHPNVVQIFDLGTQDGTYFIAMEYVPGWDLATIAEAARERSRPMPIEVACRIASDVCAGLAAAHTLVDDAGRPMGVVHRDVSPHNVLISPQGSVKLTDFGIAKANGLREKTEPGALKGKIAYMSPEQIEASDIDARSDIFAAGVLLHECLSNHQLFHRSTPSQTFMTILTGEIPALKKSRPDLPDALEAIVKRALARKRDERYQTAEEMKVAIDRFLVSFGKPATPGELSGYVRRLMEVEEVPVSAVPTRPG